MGNNKIRLAIGILLLVLMIIGVVLLIGRQHQPSESSLLDEQQKKFAATATADPILRYLPYGDRGYNLSSTFQTRDNKRVLILVISVIFYDSDYRLSPADMQAAITNRQNQALNYIKSIGFDPSKYQIEYAVPPH